MFKATVGVCAYFTLAVGKSTTGEIIHTTPHFHNLVLDAGLNRMGTANWFQYIAVGTGNSTPDVGQTKLDNYFARQGASWDTAKASYGGDWFDNPVNAPYISYLVTCRFNAGTFNNINLAEVGVGWDDAANQVNLWNRELIKNSLGQPSTITILSDEFLDVTVELRLYIDTATNETTINVYDSFAADAQPVGTRVCKTRYVRPSSPSMSFGAVGLASENSCSLFSGADTGKWHTVNYTPAGGLGNNDSYYGGYVVNDPYIQGSLQKTFGGGFPLTRGIGSVKCVYMHCTIGSYLMEFDTPIIKTGDDKFETRITLVWSRHVE